jgi:hypothetical protein
MFDRSSRLPSLALAVALLLGACAGDEAAGQAGGSGGAGNAGSGGSAGSESEGGSGGVGGEGGTLPGCALGFEEPTGRAWAMFEPKPWSELGSITMMSAYIQGDRGSNAGESGRTYWLAGNETPCFWIRVAFGPIGPPGGTANVMALVDGIQVPFTAPVASEIASVPVPGQAWSEPMQACVDVSSVDDGRHILAIQVEADGVHEPTIGVLHQTFTVYKNSFCVPDLPFTESTSRPGAVGTVVNPETGDYLPAAPWDVIASTEGRLPVRISMPRPADPSSTGDTVFFAFFLLLIVL